jgi:hypothetical protein
MTQLVPSMSVSFRRRAWTSTDDATSAPPGQEGIQRLARPHVRSGAATAAKRLEAPVAERLADAGGRLESAVNRRIRGREGVRGAIGLGYRVRAISGYSGEFLAHDGPDKAAEGVLDFAGTRLGNAQAGSGCDIGTALCRLQTATPPMKAEIRAPVAAACRHDS